jgi:hypothetical protein
MFMDLDRCQVEEKISGALMKIPAKINAILAITTA